MSCRCNLALFAGGLVGTTVMNFHLLQQWRKIVGAFNFVLGEVSAILESTWEVN